MNRLIELEKKSNELRNIIIESSAYAVLVSLNIEIFVVFF